VSEFNVQYRVQVHSTRYWGGQVCSTNHGHYSSILHQLFSISDVGVRSVKRSTVSQTYLDQWYV